MAEYYKNMILWAVTEGHKNYLKNWKDLLSIAVEGETTFQHTCECASLVIGLDQCREVIWETYTEEEQKKIAEYLMGFGVEKTESHNWRLFNMLILGFLWKEGYEIDTGLMRDHSQSILTYYAGDGWYRDGHRFDYYTPWAFQVYGPVWNQWYGYENEPEIAAKIEEYANAMTDVFSSMFDSQGHVTLWGRSGIYRNAAASPYASAFLLNHPKADPGYARWVNSGALLQFITREDVFVNGVPALGFYGQFLPMVQGYSCAESPYWIANPMVAFRRITPSGQPGRTGEIGTMWERTVLWKPSWMGRGSRRPGWVPTGPASSAQLKACLSRETSTCLTMSAWDSTATIRGKPLIMEEQRPCSTACPWGRENLRLSPM